MIKHAGVAVWLGVVLALGCMPATSGESGECTPRACDPNVCGAFADDGCGAPLDCGGCAEGGACSLNVCVAPNAAPAVRIVGRTEPKSDGSHHFGYPGTSFEARFRGTAVSVRLEDFPPSSRHTNHFAFRIDGGEPQAFAAQEGEAVYPLATGLADGEHLVQLYKRTEGFVGPSRFAGFEFPGGGELLAPRANRKRILFVGDSITTGYGLLGPGPSCKFAAAEEDFLSTYAGLTAEALNADVVAVAAAGKGVLRNVDGTETDTMFELFDRVDPFEPRSRWAGNDAPNLVVIHLGTNDFATGVPPKEAFVGRYLALIDKVRAVAPAAPILVALSPMLSDSYPKDAFTRSHARIDLETVVARRAQQGDPNVSLVEFQLPTTSEPYGCEWHPGPATHRTMVERLKSHVEKLGSW